MQCLRPPVSGCESCHCDSPENAGLMEARDKAGKLFVILSALLMTPLIYLAHFLIDRYLGSDAERLKAAASEDRGHW